MRRNKTLYAAINTDCAQPAAAAVGIGLQLYELFQPEQLDAYQIKGRLEKQLGIVK